MTLQKQSITVLFTEKPRSDFPRILKSSLLGDLVASFIFLKNYSYSRPHRLDSVSVTICIIDVTRRGSIETREFR